MDGYVATVNTPGYLPEGKAVIFDTAREAWAYHAEQRERDEESASYDEDDPDRYEFSEILTDLRALGAATFDNGEDYTSVTDWGTVNPDGQGFLHAHTPGRRLSEHDLGLRYCVTWVEGFEYDED